MLLITIMMIIVYQHKDFIKTTYASNSSKCFPFCAFLRLKKCVSLSFFDCYAVFFNYLFIFVMFT